MLLDFKKQKTSWTKYDIVQALDVIYSTDTIKKYMNKEIGIDEPILKSFLGIKTLSDPIPSYWMIIQNYPREKKIFALLALIFTHGDIVEDFAKKYSKGNMKGVFTISEKNIKQETNLRSALVESGASKPYYRREEKVPYDFSIVFYNSEIGPLFKEVLIERISRHIKGKITDETFYEICYANLFPKALSLSKEQFKAWLEGETFKASYVKKLFIKNFFCIDNDVNLDFHKSKEIYFLGENGDGKTLVLMAICLAFKGNFILEKTEKDKTGKAEDILKKHIDSLQGEDEYGRIYSSQNAIFLDNLFAYGTHRGRYSTDEPEEYGFMTLFDNDLTLKNPVSWLKDLKLAEDEINLSQNISESIVATNKLETILYDLLERKVKTIFKGSNVFFVEKGFELTLEQLSEGYRSILIFVCDLLYRLLSKKNDLKDDIFKTKAVVLVDEIDQHLHPKWQRVVVNSLRNLFPNIQFFFTTHSPTMIQGASEDAIIYKVYRENGKSRISEPFYRRDLDHLMMNTLLTSSLFDLEDARLDTDNNQSVTDDSYLIYRINKKVDEILSEERLSGKNYFSDFEIDKLIDDAINEELENEEDK